MSFEQIDFPETRHSPLITRGREDGHCYYLVAKQYENGHASLTAIKLSPDDRMGGSSKKRKVTKKGDMDEKTLTASQSRAKRSVRERCFQFQPDRMLTLTFKENLEDLTMSRAKLHYFLKLCRWRWPNFTYVVVPERQKRGAIHFHLAIRGFHNVRTLRRLWLRAAGQSGGNVDITNPRKYGKNSWNPKRIAQYLGKYLTKADIVDFNQRRFSSGGDIPPVKRATGFLALGLSVAKVADDVLIGLVSKARREFWESDHFFSIQFYST